MLHLFIRLGGEKQESHSSKGWSGLNKIRSAQYSGNKKTNICTALGKFATQYMSMLSFCTLIILQCDCFSLSFSATPQATRRQGLCPVVVLSLLLTL